MRKLGFPANEKLKSRKKIEQLFAEGKSYHKYPIRIVWLADDESGSGVKAAVTVSKKRYKRAVDRNLIKRRIREAYRLHKEGICHIALNGEKPISIMFIYTGTEIFSFSKIEESIIQLLKYLQKTLHE